ncbi:altronate dehydratase family protein [Anaerocolumna sp. AGMB13025]|uniref:UxaA family hydrolase n=1 Tax=Anaerocolumna sp. AGMB13025 TaxID=3039116 RepID=UPI00241D82A7|nr:altronate dehydratase family protein [Anaerocolumna sp. AGMB13025]WFR54852.1 altronate dehydratase family protein [Anaerocolumna sp. AGMB13025]
MQEYIKIHKSDNVAVALKELQAGTGIKIGEKDILLSQTIPAGHKFAIRDIDAGGQVIKYGYPIGTAASNISSGSFIHTHNLMTALSNNITYEYKPDYTELKTMEKIYFNGYRREDTKVGIRNEIWIIPTVGCVNSVASALEKQAATLITGNIDNILAFTHPYGCSQMGEDQEYTRTILADLIRHPNAGGVLVLGLGCENSNIEELKPYIGTYDEKRVKFLTCQETEDEMEAGFALLEELAAYAHTFQREKISVDELIIGLKCGGSDGLSGITANPLAGAFSDILISRGGTTILTEVPEMFGAETILMNRCRSEKLFEKTVAMIQDFKEYYINNNQTIYENPSPGNKKGGISTLEDKSLGCTQKSGSAPVADVLAYGEMVRTKGLNLLSAPGNDLVAATALAAAGAHIVLFTTGRGTPFASPVPTVKIASNTALYEKKKNWIDFNAGILMEDKGKDELAEELFMYCLNVASGELVKSEKAGFHDMAVFKKGVTL